jgi:hypothetical protein
MMKHRSLLTSLFLALFLCLWTFKVEAKGPRVVNAFNPETRDRHRFLEADPLTDFEDDGDDDYEDDGDFEEDGSDSVEDDLDATEANKDCFYLDDLEAIEVDILIAGAGMAGISAGKTLADHSNLNFIIVEASGRVGGRMYPYKLGDYTVELGAQWVSGTDLSNPFAKLAKDVRLRGYNQDFDFFFYDNDGARNRSEQKFRDGTAALEMDKVSRRGERLAQECLQQEGVFTESQFCNKLVKKVDRPFNPDDDGEDFTVQRLYKSVRGWDPAENPLEGRARTMESYYFDFEYGEAPNVTSARLYSPIFTYEDFTQTDRFTRDRRGFSITAKELGSRYLNNTAKRREDGVLKKIKFDDSRIAVKTKVLKITWDPQGSNTNVKALVCRTKKVTRDDGVETFPCKSGKRNYYIISAREFIPTWSIGVWQKILELERQSKTLPESVDVAPRLEPPLSNSAELAAAIDSQGFGVYAKVWFQFTKKFWPNSEYFLSAASSDVWIGDLAPVWLVSCDGNGCTRYSCLFI